MNLADLLANDEALLTRTHLRQLGLDRRAADAVFRSCPTVKLPGFSRAMVKVGDYRRFIEEQTYRGDRVRPAA